MPDLIRAIRPGAFPARRSPEEKRNGFQAWMPPEEESNLNAPGVSPWPPGLMPQTSLEDLIVLADARTRRFLRRRRSRAALLARQRAYAGHDYAQAPRAPGFSALQGEIQYEFAFMSAPQGGRLDVEV